MISENLTRMLESSACLRGATGAANLDFSFRGTGVLSEVAQDMEMGEVLPVAYGWETGITPDNAAACCCRPEVLLVLQGAGLGL